MGSKIVGWAWEQKTDKPIDKMVLVALADYAAKDGFSYPSQRELADMAQCSIDTVQRALKRLIARGLVEQATRWRANGGRSSNGYTVLYDGRDTATPLPQTAAGPMPQAAAPPMPHHAAGHAAPVRQGIPQLCGMHNDPPLDPPTEPSPTGPRSGPCVEGAPSLEVLRLEGRALHVVENLIAPLLGVLAFERRRDPAAVPLALLQGIRDACAEFSPRALSEAARALRDTRTEWPSTAIAKRTAQEAQARTMIRIAPGTPQWDAWIEHWKASGKPFLVRTYEQEGSARVPTEFPPAADPVKSTADKYITADGRKPGAAA